MRSLAVLLAITVFLIYSLGGNGQEPSAKPPAAPQPAIRAALEKVSPSVVRMWHGSPAHTISGVIVSKDGLIVTVGHFSANAGESVEVQLPGKKPVMGKVLAKLKAPDLALVQIAEKGTWPAVEISSSGSLTDSDPLLALGFGDTGLYGHGGREPPCYTRLGYRRKTIPPLRDGLLQTSVFATWGDSGGPVFDLTGSLVGIVSAGELDGTNARYVPSDLLLQAWKDLAGDRPAPARSSAPRPIVHALAAATTGGVRAVRPSVVEVRCDDRWAGVGSYVGDGFIVTKASELGSKMSVVLGDNVVALVRVAATDPSRDLALLRLTVPDLARGMTPVDWGAVKDLPVGTILAAVTPPAFTPPTGVVCIAAQTIAPLPGLLPVSVKDAKGGVEITDTFDFLDRWLRKPPFPLHLGDVITHVAGVPVANRDAFIKLNGAATLGGHPRVRGEAIRVTCWRNGKSDDVTVYLHSQRSVQNQLVRPYSYRYSGFPTALASDLAARPEHCGAPVVDADGRVVGLLIARAPFIESLILPSAEMRAAVEVMRKSAAAKN
jgi:S1-C subfamily serine protease